MRKLKICLLILIVFATNKTNAQLKDNLSLGPIVGFGHSWVTNSYSPKFKPSLNIGGRLLYSASPKFGVGLDATFRTEGVKGKLNAISINYTTTDAIPIDYNTNYLRLDPKLYYFFGKYGHALRPKIGVGPSFGFLVSGKSDLVTGINTTEAFASKKIRKSFDVGLSGSIGFNYRLKSKTWLNVDAVFNHGLTDVAKFNTGDAIQNRSLFLNIGVTFGIGHAGKK